MALTIRLRREGTKNRPFFRVVVTEKSARRDGRFVEIIGTYDPEKDVRNCTIDLTRVDHWVGVGAIPSDTVKTIVGKIRDAAKVQTEIAV